MNRFKWAMAGLCAFSICFLAYFAMRSDELLGQLGFAALVLLGILLIPQSFFPSRAAKSDPRSLEDLDPDVLDRVSQISNDGHMIEAIKELRAATGMGLAEAKDIVELIKHKHQQTKAPDT